MKQTETNVTRYNLIKGVIVILGFRNIFLKMPTSTPEVISEFDPTKHASLDGRFNRKCTVLKQNNEHHFIA
jgi:hypothetical protein